MFITYNCLEKPLSRSATPVEVTSIERSCDLVMAQFVTNALTEYFIRPGECAKSCDSGKCQSLDVDSLYNSMILSNKSALINSLFDSSGGEACRFPGKVDPLTTTLRVGEDSFYLTNKCLSKCFFGCVRHVPSSSERAELYSQNLGDLLLFKCGSILPWMVLVGASCLLILFAALSVIARFCLRNPLSTVVEKDTMAENVPTGEHRPLKTMNPGPTAQKTKRPIQPISRNSIDSPDSCKPPVESASLTYSKASKSVTVSNKKKKESQLSFVSSSKGRPKKARERDSESKVLANTWIVEQLSDDQ
uniref:PAN domain protein n=1 Tax=Steinernema glaseri TaxID=37863 RepID=A0A1I8AVS9_9BILA